MPLITALRRQEGLCEFEASLVYRVSSRTASTVVQRNKTKQKNKNRGQVTKMVELYREEQSSPRTEEI